MSKCHPMLVLIAGGLLGGVLVSSLNSPTAMAGGVVSGRKANSIQSFFFYLSPGKPGVVPSVPGDRGFIITDIYLTGGPGTPSITVKEDDEVITRVSGAGVHFEAGIRVNAASRLTFEQTAGSPHVTMTGYTF